MLQFAVYKFTNLQCYNLDKYVEVNYALMYCVLNFSHSIIIRPTYTILTRNFSIFKSIP